MATYIFNCKHCKVGRRVEYPYKSPSGANYRLGADGRRIDACIYIRAIGGGRPTLYGGDTEMGLCPQCRRKMEYGPLAARLSPEQKCDARCTSARGHNCECQCGGENHGVQWSA